MADVQAGPDQVGQPKTQPTTTPQYGLDPQGLMGLQTAIEMQKSLTEIEVKLGRLLGDFEKADQKLVNLDRSVDRVKTAAYVATVLISAFFVFIWWVIGDRITNAVHNGVDQAVSQALKQQLPQDQNNKVK